MSSRGSKKRKQREQLGMAEVEAVRITRADDQVSVSVSMGDLPVPEKTFSADAALVVNARQHGAVYVYFVAAAPSLTAARRAVRIRLPYTFLMEQVQRDAGFHERLSVAVEGMRLAPEGWRPTADELDSLPSDAILALEGSFTKMAHYGEIAMVDVYALPPDFVHRSRENQPWTVTPVVRVMVPTVVLCDVVADLNAAVGAFEG